MSRTLVTSVVQKGEPRNPGGQAGSLGRKVQGRRGSRREFCCTHDVCGVFCESLSFCYNHPSVTLALATCDD